MLRGKVFLHGGKVQLNVRRLAGKALKPVVLHEVDHDNNVYRLHPLSGIISLHKEGIA